MVAQYERYGYLNGAVLVAEHGRVIYARGVGYARMESHFPNTPQTRFDIASITKQFTAVLVPQQVEEGRMRLNDKLSAYLSWYRKDTGDRITIEQLLHHTSGLPPDFDTPEFSQSIEASRHYEPQAFAEQFCQQKLVSEPGTKWNYSNCGYILVGLILERATRESFGDLLRTRLLEPLGMKDSGMDRNDLVGSGGASGYLSHAGPRYTPGPPFDSDHGFSAGAMYSTVEDLFRWNQALSANAPFSPDIRDQIFRAGLNNWAYGWFVSKIPAGTPGAGSTLAEMRGDLPGNYFCVDPALSGTGQRDHSAAKRVRVDRTFGREYSGDSIRPGAARAKAERQGSSGVSVAEADEMDRLEPGGERTDAASSGRVDLAGCSDTKTNWLRSRSAAAVLRPDRPQTF
jgi:CubicO group peptidase (beta-lactamase class C family)